MAAFKMKGQARPRVLELQARPTVLELLKDQFVRALERLIGEDSHR
jgi:hypothetical protein